MQVQDRDAVDDREDAAVAAEDAVLDFVAVSAVEQGGDQVEAAAAIGAPEKVERVASACIEALELTTVER